MYCKNCECKGCQLVPEIARLRSELRGLRKAQENAKASLDQAERELFRFSSYERDRCESRCAAFRRGLPTQAIVGQSLDQLVDQAAAHARQCQQRVNELRSLADPMTALEILSRAVAADGDTTDAKSVLRNIQEAKGQLDAAETELERAKQRVVIQQREREVYRQRLGQLRIAEEAVARFDHDRQAWQEKVQQCQRDLADLEPKIQDINDKIADGVRALYRIHRARRPEA